jgi:hypothetical protein
VRKKGAQCSWLVLGGGGVVVEITVCGGCCHFRHFHADAVRRADHTETFLEWDRSFTDN